MSVGFTSDVNVNSEGDSRDVVAISPRLSPLFGFGLVRGVVVYDRNVCLVKNEPTVINDCKVIRILYDNHFLGICESFLLIGVVLGVARVRREEGDLRSGAALPIIQKLLYQRISWQPS